MLGVTLRMPAVTALTQTQTNVDHEKVENVVSNEDETIRSYLTV